jgi:hypothetical protein
MKNEYLFLVGKCEGKAPIGRTKHAQKDKIKMDIKERGCQGVV